MKSFNKPVCCARAERDVVLKPVFFSLSCATHVEAQGGAGRMGGWSVGGWVCHYHQSI